MIDSLSYCSFLFLSFTFLFLSFTFLFPSFTFSILHLLAIAIDRYWAVTNIDYIHHRNGSRIGIMIVIIWLVASLVSLAPNFGWEDPQFKSRVEIEKRCLVSQDILYQIFATIATFYGPLIVILALYWKIYQVFVQFDMFDMFDMSALV